MQDGKHIILCVDDDDDILFFLQTVLEAAGYSDSVNTLAKAFSRRTDWSDFIKEERGRCWMFT